MTRSSPRRSRGSRRYSLGVLLTGWAAIGLAILLVGGTFYAYVQYRSVWDGIKHVTLKGLGHRPPKYNDALNILLIGSDSRSGANEKIGGGDTPGQRSDTVMVMHISPGRHRISVLSFPRDSVVPILACPAEPGFSGQAAQPGVIEQLNATFAFGGPNCLLHTLEQLTQIRLDDFIQLNFTGFITVINALGGVEVCLPVAIHPTYYDHLNLKAGKHLIQGYQALELWRLREDFGLGSDLQRIERDQLLMVGLVQRILKSGLLHSPAKTYSMMKEIVSAHALTTDSGLTPTKILSIATSMSGISRKSIQFIEVPTITYTPNPNWVQFDPTQTPKLFYAVAHDSKLPKLKKAKKAVKGPAPRLLSTSKVSVEVLNGSGVPNIAGTTATALGARGFHELGSASAMTSSGADDFSYTKSVVEYSSAADLPAAQTVAAQLGTAPVTLRKMSTVTAGTVTLILGSTFKALAPEGSQAVSNLTGQYGGYTGNTNVCKDTGAAFAGAVG
jgi:LCP family protein required for cell wall assembly